MNITLNVTDLCIDATERGAYAYLNSPTPDWVKGSPMGRGTTVAEAIDDLVYRVRIESHVDLTITGATS